MGRRGAGEEGEEAVKDFNELMELTKKRRNDDAARWRSHDPDLCMLCGARGPDKRGLFIDCLYDLTEAIPEVLDLSDVKEVDGFYLRICKGCRADLIGTLSEWRRRRVARREVMKNHDGNDLPTEERDIPMRMDGTTKWMTREEFEAERRKP